MYDVVDAAWGIAWRLLLLETRGALTYLALNPSVARDVAVSRNLM
jgi:hypothetical protein